MTRWPSRGVVHRAAIWMAAAIVIASGVTAHAQETDGRTEPAFSLSTSQVFTSKDAPHFYLTFRHLASLDVRVYKVAEIVVLTAGLTLMMLFPRHTPLYAAGLGCLLQASVLLVLDRVAERRAREYAAGLDATSSPRPGPDRA